MTRNTHSFKKILVVALTTFCVLYALIFIACKVFLSPKELKPILVSKLESSLNRKVTLGDDLNLGVSWDMSPYIQLKNITISNSTWGSKTAMLSIEKLNLKLKLWPLLFKKVYIDSLVLTNPNIHLETSNNRNNWDFSNDTDKKDSSSGVSLDINQVHIVNGLLSYKDNNKAARIIKIDNLSVDNNDTKFNIKKMNIHIGGSNLSGSLELNKNNLSVEGDLESSLLTLSDLYSSGGGSGGEYNIPNDALPIEKLKEANINVTIKVKKLVIDKIILTSVNLTAETKDKVLHIALDPAATIFDGNLNFDLAYDLKPKTPTLALNLKTSPIKLENFAPITGSSIKIKSKLVGTGSNLNSIVGSFTGNILATASPGSYLNSSSGFSNLLTSILSSAITFEKAKPSTSFSCAVVNFKVNNGVAITDKGIALEASTANVVGSGKIDLRNGRLNLSVNPQGLSDNSGLNISQLSMGQLVNVTGTISKPSISLNPIGLIAGSTISKAVLSSIMGGMTGGLASVAQSVAITDHPESHTKDICKKALEM